MARLVLISLLLLAGLASAQCQTSIGCPSVRCDAQYFISQINVAAGQSNSASQINGLYLQYTQCTAFGSSQTTPCCVDPCNAYTSTEMCSADRNCLALPKSTSGSADNPAVCVRKDKLCGLLPMNGACSGTTPPYPFCGMINGECVYVDPVGATPATPAAGAADLSGCPALHPMVIAMLSMMFITLVAAIIIVGVIVVLNQKKADREEAEREAAALRQGRR